MRCRMGTDVPIYTSGTKLLPPEGDVREAVNPAVVRTVYGRFLITAVKGGFVEPYTAIHMFFPEEGLSKIVESPQSMSSLLREILE